MPTLKDLARVCGVDVSTVSRALADHPRVSAGTRDRIRAQAEAIGYRPNLAARSLQAGRTRNLWLLVPSLDGARDREPAQHAVRAAHALGYDLLIAVASDPVVAGRMGRRLGQGVCDGCLVLPGPSAMVEAFLAAAPPVPLVYIDRWPERGEVAAVTTANAEAAATLVDHLAHAGCDGLVLDMTTVNGVQRERRAGALAAARRLGWSSRRTARRPGILANDQRGAERCLARGVQPRAIAVFDAWIGDPWPAGRAFIAIQDFATMARTAVEILIEAIQAGGSPATGLRRVALTGIETVISRVGV